MGRLYDAFIEVGPRFTGLDAVKKEGDKAGKEYGERLAAAATKAAEARVSKLGEALGKARTAEADAAGKVRVAEAKLVEVREKFGATSARAVAAEETLAAAQRKSSAATDAASKAASSLEKARDKAAKSAQQSGAESGEKFNKGLKDALAKTRAGGDEGKDAGDRFGIGFSQTLPGIGGRVSTFFKSGVGAAAGLLAGAAIGTKLLEGFQGALEQGDTQAKFQAQLGLSDAETAKAGKVAGDLFKDNYGESLGQVNDAIRRVVQDTNVGLNSVDLKPVAGKVLSLASTFDQDLGGVTRATGQLIRTGLAKDATQALDIITKGFQSGADKSEDFLDTLNEYGTQFRKMGIDGATATGLISQGLKAGARDGDIVADAIKEFSIRAVDGSKTTSAGFKSLGLDAEKMAAQIAKGGKPAAAGLDQVLDRLRKVKDPVKQSQIAVELFGTQAEDLGKALFSLDPSSAVKGIGDVAGAAGKLDETVGSTPQATLSSYFRTIKQNSTDSFATVVQAFATGEAGAKGFQGFLQQLGVGARAVFDGIRDSVKSFVAGWSADEDTMLASGFPGFMQKLGLAARGVFDYFKAEVLPRLREFGTYIRDTVIPIVVDIASNHLAKLREAFGTVKQAIQDNKPQLDQIGSAIQTVAKFLIEQLIPFLYKAAQETLPLVGNAIGAVITTIGYMVTAFNGIKDAVRAALAYVTEKFLDFVQKMLDGGAKAFGWVPGVGDKLKTAAKDFATFRDDVNNALDGISDEAINIKIAYSSTGVNLTSPSSVGRRATGGPGGPVRAPGTGRTSDRAGLYALSDTEWVIQSSATQKYGDRTMASVNAGTAAIIPGFKNGGSPGLSLGANLGTGSLAKSVASSITAMATVVAKQLAKNGGGLAGTMAFGRSQEGKPYVWGAGGPNGYDCSGFVSALINYAKGRNPFQRLGATGSMPWSDMAAGVGRFMVGWFKGNPGHTAATINGVNFESRGGRGVVVGPAARGAYDALFTNRAKVKGFAKGGRPGLDGDLPFDLLNPRGKQFQAEMARALGVPKYDTGGPWPPGTLGFNGTGKTETVRTAEQEAKLGGPVNVRVFIGDQELRGLVRVEVDDKFRDDANSFNL
jgi:hypothetical protein